jgi:class 3 adenylate cyclase/tetratricopeptide (TPR) repeat protein
MAACAACGQLNPDEARFCSACASPLVPEAAHAGELRKTVTVVFSDIANSTRLGERLDPESHRRVMGRYFTAMHSALERHGGTVEKFIGDAVMAVFGIPTLHEDDALRAVRAAVEMRTALEEVNRALRREWELEIAVRTGINTGEVVAGAPGTMQTLITGDAVVVAKRLEESAGPDEIQLGESTYRLVREAVVAEPLGPIDAKGKPQLAAWRLLEVQDGDGTVLRLDSPLVGRAGDLRALQSSFELAQAEQACRLFTVLGPAGIGKSRLIHEFVGWLGDRATVLQGRCLPYGDGITFWPLVEVVRQAAAFSDRDSADEARRKIAALLEPDEDAQVVSERVAAAVGRGQAATARPDETFWAVRRLFESIAHERPLVVVIDDVQWSENTLLDLIEYIAGWTRGAPVLLCCIARPDLLELRPSWGLPKPNATSILLKPLQEHETDELIANLLGKLPFESRAGIAAVAEGNPLFVEELLRTLVDEGLLRRDDGDWVAAGNLGELGVPPTIQALLSARLDRLGPEERAVIQRASVVGQVFWWGAVADLSPATDRPEVGAHLQSLVRKELIRHERSKFWAEDAFRFEHILIRDAAYAALPKEARADLHEELAGWLERRGGDRAAEYEEFVGYHLEQAVRYRAELGWREEKTDALAQEAGRRLASAGRRAVARADASAAANLLGRGARLLAHDAPERGELLVDLAEALHETGELQRAREILQQALDGASASGDDRVEARARLELANLRPLFDPGSVALEELQLAGEHAVAVFERLGDDRRLARALLRIADAHWLHCRVTPGEPLLERARELATRSGDARELSQIRFGLARAAALGPMHAEAAIDRCREILEESAGDRYAEGVTANALAYLEGMRGSFDEARELAARSRTILEDLGLVLAASVLDVWTGQIELLAGDPAAAERIWRASYETLELLGERGNLSTIAAFLAEALSEQEADDEAQRLTEVSEQTASEDDATSQIAWRVTRAKLLARRGEPVRAEELAREAVARADQTEWPNLRGSAWASLAEVLLAADRTDEAARAAEEAVEIYDAKGNLPAAARARDLVRARAAPDGRAS